MKSNFDSNVAVRVSNYIYNIKVVFDTDTRIINDLSVAIPWFQTNESYIPLYDWSIWDEEENPPYWMLDRARKEMFNYLSPLGVEGIPSFLTKPVRNRTTWMKQFSNDILMQFLFVKGLEIPVDLSGPRY